MSNWEISSFPDNNVQGDFGTKELHFPKEKLPIYSEQDCVKNNKQ